MVAKQIMVIQTALAAGMRYTVFEGRTMFVNSSLAMFITMNPMYDFRSVLPANLKVRPLLTECRDRGTQPAATTRPSQFTPEVRL